jgi:hypothetical protein
LEEAEISAQNLVDNRHWTKIQPERVPNRNEPKFRGTQPSHTTPQPPQLQLVRHHYISKKLWQRPPTPDFSCPVQGGKDDMTIVAAAKKIFTKAK